MLLVVPAYDERDPARRAELEHCLRTNGVLPFVRVVEHRSQDRPLFRALFEAGMVAASAGEVVVVANGDIAFDESLKLATALPEGEAWALSRWERTETGATTEPTIDSAGTQDSFVVRAPMKPAMLDIPIGHPGSDNRLCWELQRAGYHLRNPSLTVRCVHHHSRETRRPWPRILLGPKLPVVPTELSPGAAVPETKRLESARRPGMRAAPPAPTGPPWRKLDESRIRIWVHTCKNRLDKLGPTLESLDASDAKGRYDVLEAPVADGPTIHKWWAGTMTRLATEPFNGSEPPLFILRLEDDVIVNRHIVHNCASWQAIHERDFGIGQLFNWDGDYPPRPCMTRINRFGSVARTDMEFYGAQGQLFRAEILPRVAALFPKLCMDRYGFQFNLDGAVVRAVRHVGLMGYLHVPSLVNCHGGSRVAASGFRHNGHFSRIFDPAWRRELPWLNA